MKIAIVASEAGPYIRTGGLGDVLSALPRELARIGHEVKLYLPRYRALKTGHLDLRQQDSTGQVAVGDSLLSYSVTSHRERRLPLETCFVSGEAFSDKDGIYVDPETHTDYPDNDRRFVFFCRSTLAAMEQLNFRPDVIHVHDWQTALIPAYLRVSTGGYSFFRNSRAVLTIHNLAYQGSFDAARYKNVGLPDELFAPTRPFEFYGKVNFLKAGICYADKITAVSQTYAREIQSKELGCGLDGVLRSRSSDLVGIMNGVDYTVWSPSRDKLIPYTFRPVNLSGKRMNKSELLNLAGMPLREKTPLVGMVTRLVDQKGIDLVIAAFDRLAAKDLQMVLLGTGEPRHHQFFESMQERYPDRFRAYLTFDDKLAHLIEAASDIFLMPSRFEPCGLNQLYSLKYGTVPVVRRVGGLADTVVDYNPDTKSGTGFVFDDYTPEAMLDAVDRAVDLFARRREWMKLMKTGMACDFSWRSSAQEYSRLFESIVDG